MLAPRLFKLGEHFIVPHSGHNKMLRVASCNRSWFDHHPALRRRRSACSAPFGSLHAVRRAGLAGIQTVVASPEVADAGYAAGIDLAAAARAKLGPALAAFGFTEDMNGEPNGTIYLRRE